jgi:hypothetical protein
MVQFMALMGGVGLSVMFLIIVAIWRWKKNPIVEERMIIRVR